MELMIIIELGNLVCYKMGRFFHSDLFRVDWLGQRIRSFPQSFNQKMALAKINLPCCQNDRNKGLSIK